MKTPELMARETLKNSSLEKLLDLWELTDNMFRCVAPALFRGSTLAICPRRIRIDHAVPPIR